MPYNFPHTTYHIPHTTWPTYKLNITNSKHERLFFHRISTFLVRVLRRLSLSRQIVPILSPLFLLFFAFNSQALTPQSTLNVINGSAPYLTFDGGLTRATNTEGLLWITLPGGNRITPHSNPSSRSNPIELQYANVRFTDIGMLVPTNTNSVALNTLIGPPNNYWGDDDGDGQGVNGVSATGSLDLFILDRDNKRVSRSDAIDICKAPYSIILSSTDGILRTRYGFPNRSYFNASSVVYYIKPKASPEVCFARPDMRFNTGNYAGPLHVWSPTRGFRPQSITPSHYDLNFPTTGAHNLYFYLDIGGVDPSTLSWPSVTSGGITASMEVVPPNPSASNVFDRPGGLRVTLTGPHATPAMMSSSSPIPIDNPNLPATFELVGRDSSGRRVATYGFVLKYWFVNRGSVSGSASISASWCSNIGYQMPRVRDLTNAQCTGTNSGYWCLGPVGAMPSSPANHYQRHINAGLFTEWGFMLNYPDARFAYHVYWTSEAMDDSQFDVDSHDGHVHRHYPSHSYYVVCTSSLRP
jgi:hypothetical protein